jgi:hypothetical protein
VPGTPTADRDDDQVTRRLYEKTLPADDSQDNQTFESDIQSTASGSHLPDTPPGNKVDAQVVQPFYDTVIYTNDAKDNQMIEFDIHSNVLGRQAPETPPGTPEVCDDLGYNTVQPQDKSLHSMLSLLAQDESDDSFEMP